MKIHIIAVLATLCATPICAQSGGALNGSSAFDGAVRILPDLSRSPAALDPDVVRPGITLADLCPHANTTSIRNVPKSEADSVYAEYGQVRFKGRCAALDPKTGKVAGCEVDHICSLELGCNNNIKNLWVQVYAGTPWTAHVKDAYENFLHSQICSKKMRISDAQHEISTDWIAGYKSHPELPIPTQ